MSEAKETRNTIIAKAAPIFNMYGYKDTTMSQLTDAIRMTKGAIYGNFTDKDEIGLAAFDYNFAEISKKIKKVVLSKATGNTIHLSRNIDQIIYLVNAALESITLIDRNYTYQIVNDAYIKARQLKREEILGHTVAEVWGREVFEHIIKKKLDECFKGKTVSFVSAYEFKKNEINYIETTYTPCFTSGSEPTHAVVISHNITELKKSQEKIKMLAYYDALTNLPSRPLFMDLLQHEIKRAKRSRRSLAVFCLDLDEFKKVNDTFGHSAGDELLISVGKRLKKYLRQSDTIGRPGGIISTKHPFVSERFARIGGDEFTFIIPNIPDKKFTTTVADKILNAFNDPFQISDKEIFISTSIGIALYPDNGNSVETLLRNADTAMYKAKERGKNIFQYYSSEMNKQAKKRISLENNMRYAIKNNEFLLYYQPQYDVAAEQIVGMEALIRWVNPEMGVISPEELIPLAEETGIIIPIGEWVLRSACRQAKIWYDQGHRNLQLGVNLSMRQFFDSQLVDKIKATVEASQYDPNFLEMEITETAMMHDTVRASHIVKDLSKLGIKISLDDFGTGYSSLSYLKNFHTDTSKIDQTFVRNADLKGRDGAIISAIVDMCHKLDIKIVAEGVETQESLGFLKKRACHVAQGYFFSAPLPAEKFQKLLECKSPLKK
jgi:PAS domain S-box-containing protein